MDSIRSSEVVENTLGNANAALSKLMGSADVIAISAPMVSGVDDIVKNEIENLKESDAGNAKNLVVMLTTGGGSIEVVERIVRIFRYHYRAKKVEFIIPNYAYSAGTVLALSGDEIYMNYYSVLGPIDPQFTTKNGRQVSGMGYIAKYNHLVEKINSVEDGEDSSVRAEMTELLEHYVPAEVFDLEQAIQHSKDLVIEWLPMYKFKDWKKTASGKKVSPEYRRNRAEKIADILGNAEHWHSHGRGISMMELESEDIGLKIKDFGADENLSAMITHYHGLLSDYMKVSSMDTVVHTRHRLRRLP